VGTRKENALKSDRRDFLKTMTSGVLTASLLPLCAFGGEKEPRPDAEGVSQKDRAKEALSLMGEYGSCCTGVLAAYAPELGMEKNLAAGVGRGMAGGIGGLGNVCGAVSGAIMVIGLKTTNEDNIHDMEAGFKTMEAVREFISRFEEQHSSIKCRELIGHDISTREKSAVAMKENAFANCPQFVESAVTILDNILSSETP
jgi:C_GCAxxG_C_C family probable redox protein